MSYFLILQKLMIYIESKDDCEVIHSIEKMECNLALLTKAYIDPLDEYF